MTAEGLFLVDTTAWVWALRGEFLEPIKARIDHLLAHDQVATTPTIILELLSGVRDKTHFTSLQARLEALHVLPVNCDCWKCAYKLAFDTNLRGFNVPATDILIAAVALTSEAVLLHADSHFDLMAEPVGLQVESHLSQVSGG